MNIKFFAILIIFANVIYSQIDYDLSELKKKYSEWQKEAEEYKFTIPESWSDNLMLNASVMYCSDDSFTTVTKIFDNETNTIWTSANYSPRPEIIFQFEDDIEFNRIVLFNRYTDARGTAGGNNATKEVEFYFSNDLESEFLCIGKYNVKGPEEVCFLIGNGQKACTFKDRLEPTIVEIQNTKCKYLKLILNEAHWSVMALEEWKSSICLSELMLFYSNE